jgi:hypothetical protein
METRELRTELAKIAQEEPEGVYDVVTLLWGLSRDGEIDYQLATFQHRLALAIDMWYEE